MGPSTQAVWGSYVEMWISLPKETMGTERHLDFKV